MSFFEKIKQNIDFQEAGKEPASAKPARPAGGATAGKEKKVKKEGKMKTPIQEQSEGQMTIDVYETEDEFVIMSAVAGIKSDDLEISIENGIVSIRGERKNPNGLGQAKYLYQECYWGPFSRQIMLPEEIDNSKAEASMKNGIFTLKIPKLKKRTNKKIVIKEETAEK